MIVNCLDRTNGELYLTSEDSKMIILHDSFWEAKPSTEENASKYSIRTLEAPIQVTLPDRFFNDLYEGIINYHASLEKDAHSTTTKSLKEIVESLESQLIETLSSLDKNLTKNYLHVKSLVPQSA